MRMNYHYADLQFAVAQHQKVEVCSIHIAVNYSHRDPAFSVFWDRDGVHQFLEGVQGAKYTFMGLNEIGNATAKRPRCLNRFLDDVHVSFAQAYTPFVKPLDDLCPYRDHPFLLVHLLGAGYVRSNSKFRHLVECTDGLKSYHALVQAVDSQLQRSSARFEVVVTSRCYSTLMATDLNQLAQFVRCKQLLIQVCT